MAPNVTSETVYNGEVLEVKQKQKQEIYYKGYFYDVTDFVDRHPGGNVIKFYTQRGEDASQAIEQFHFRNRKKVDAIMKSFKKRPAEPHERGLDAKVLTKHEALSKDFKELFEQLQAEGYFEPSIRHVTLRLLECFSTVIFALGVFFSSETFTGKFLSSVLIGFSYSRHGWMMHEGGHMSFTGIPKLDRILQDISVCFVLGGSSLWWNSQHNRHHAMPQRVNRDVDLATLPFVAFHTKTVKDKKEIHNFFVRYQGIFYWTLDLLIVTFAWRFFLHPRYQLHRKAYLEMLLGLPNLIFVIYIGPHWFFLISYWFAFFLGINFALSHSHLDVTEEPTHWIEYSLTHTANIEPTMWVDYVMGYLNYQIEHHLFPAMPQFRQKEICHRVKALADKHGLPYRVYGYFEACYLAVKNLNDVGKELTSKDHFSGKVKET